MLYPCLQDTEVAYDETEIRSRQDGGTLAKVWALFLTIVHRLINTFFLSVDQRGDEGFPQG